MNIGAELEATLVSAAIGAYPRECVALLGGKSGQITSLYGVANVAGEPERTYLVDPGDQLEAEAEMAARGEDLIAIFHSHPRGPAVPSPTDRLIARHRPDVAHVIVAVDHQELRAWRLDGQTWEEIEDVRCSCGVTEPDYFGNRDSIETWDCPVHAAVDNARDPFNDLGAVHNPNP